jgi:hypothetical protein
MTETTAITPKYNARSLRLELQMLWQLNLTRILLNGQPPPQFAKGMLQLDSSQKVHIQMPKNLKRLQKFSRPKKSRDLPIWITEMYQVTKFPAFAEAEAVHAVSSFCLASLQSSKGPPTFVRRIRFFYLLICGLCR